MKTPKPYLLFLLSILIALPLVFAFDFTATISDTLTLTDSLTTYTPTSGTTSDAFSASDSLSVLLGQVTSIRDDLHLSDNRNASCVYCQFTNGLPGVPSSSAGNKFASNENIAGNTTLSIYITQGIIPFGLLFGIGLLGLRVGLNGFGIIGLGLFVILVLAWIGIIPSWTIILVIIFTAFLIAYMISKFIGTEQN